MSLKDLVVWILSNKTKSSSPKGPKVCPKGHKLDVGAIEAPRLLLPLGKVSKPPVTESVR